MSISFLNKKIFSVFFIIAVLLFSTTTEAFSASRSHIERKRKETHAKIIRLKILERQETNKLYRNQLKLEKSEKELKNSRLQYTTTQMKLGDLERNLSQSLSTFSITEFQARNRIRQIYKKQRSGLFQLLLSTNDLNLFLDRIHYQNIIAKKDKHKLNYVKERARRIARLKYQVEEERKNLVGTIQNINYQQQNIQGAIDRNASMIQKLRTDRFAYERSEKELARQSANLRNMISRNTGHSEIKVATGFIKPIAGCITSPFGWRVHPIFRSRTFHSGLDIGGPYGCSVRASNSGRVIYSGWYGGYGKVVIIDHGRYNGSPTTTLYAHLSSYAVGVGDYVAKGQTIAREGSTGYSTGPHLHFEVRINGQPCNPLNFI